MFFSLVLLCFVCCVFASQVLFIKLMSVQDPDEEGYRSVSHESMYLLVTAVFLSLFGCGGI